MVATLTKLSDPAAAAAYYEADDYYTRDAGGHWHGRGAEALGLSGEVDPEQFAELLAGRLPDGTLLGTTRHGIREHKAGWDLTMSAPKSVSTMALVAGDRRLIDAHARAVTTALDYAERHAAATRIRDGEAVERVNTGKLAIARFTHVTARATENGTPAPQLHTHSVIVNATQRADGAWRSVESRDLYRLQKDIGAIYHRELATEVQRLGYAVTTNPDTTFEIDGVPQDVLRAFSPRAAQIEAALDERGKSRATASAAEKNVIALDTRAPKRHVDQTTLTGTWRAEADGLGFGEDTRRAMVAQAEARSTFLPQPSATDRSAAAETALRFAAAMLSERDATFSAAQLEREASIRARGSATHADILAAIAHAEATGDLVSRAAPRLARGAAGFATRQAIDTETRMLAIEAAGRERFAPLHDRIHAARTIAAAQLATADHGHAWTDSQRKATRGLLLSPASVTAIQGHAGTAKTTTVIATYAKAAREQGLTVRALAPTATAAELLGQAIDAEPLTVARMLLGHADDIERGREAWIVDEASMLSARDSEALLFQARKAEARLILVGDVRQLGSVEAGRAFGQLQEHGMATHVLDQIVRQTNAHTREAVEAILAGEAARAFEAIDQGGGRIVEQGDDAMRYAAIARDYAQLSATDRARTLVLDPTREGRQRLTDAIRAELVRDGTLGAEAITATTLEPLGLTRAEASDAASYAPGQIVTFRRGSREQRLSRGRAYRVEAIDAEAGTISLATPQGKAITWSPARWGGDQAEAFVEIEQELRTGDRIQFTRNNRRAGRLNGHTASVVGIDPQRGGITIEREDGKHEALDLTRLTDRHIRPGWVRTIHSAQGATADRVMAHLESFRANTVDAPAVYVAISRARDAVALYTDSRASLTEALGLRDGAQIGAIDGVRREVEMAVG
ncbi:MAG: relaxase domain-containing protein [Erythrobacter sp.]|nr:relaxase domain-containing protein [Erythrobacter sp.]